MVKCQTRRADPVRGGFSFVELIGVLAVLAILACLLLPRVMNQASPARTLGAVNQSRVNVVLANVQAIKSAAAQHCARFGSLASRNGTSFTVAASYDNYDAILLAEQLLDRPFWGRLGSSGTIRLLKVHHSSWAGRLGFVEGEYDLDGNGGNDVAGAAYVLEAVLRGITDQDARALNDALDGPALGANPGEDDSRGRVTYRGGDPANLREVHIYIMHQ
jgi:hypothetical protein